jgi:uncharacterized protein (TIGR00369 family)
LTEFRTHLKINQRLCGEPIAVADGSSRVVLTTRSEMAADGADLVHGGFVFGLADYAAMLAVNHPHVVLGSADVQFLKPVKVGETLRAAASIQTVAGKKQIVDVVVKKDETSVFKGRFTCFVLERHVLAEPQDSS